MNNVFGGAPADTRPRLAHDKNSRQPWNPINNILDIEKMESGGMIHKPAVIDVYDVRLQRAVGMNQACAETLSVRFGPALPVEPPRIQADPCRLVQVPARLLSRAAKFSLKNESVILSYRIVEERVRLEIRDRGPGIFSPSFRFMSLARVHRNRILPAPPDWRAQTARQC